MINLTLQSHVPVIIGITLVVAIFVLIAYSKLKKYNPLDEPKGLVLLCIMLVEWINSMVKEIVGEEYIDKLGPFIGTLAVYILLANYVGLLGFDNPTLNYSVTLAITLVAWIIFQLTEIKFSGLKNYLHTFIEPVFAFLPANIFSALAPLISMSMRLFGNILSGAIIMGIMYSATSLLSNKLFPFLNGLNVIGPIFGSVLHLYFDLFAGFLQMYLFIMLTMVFIGTRIPEDAKNKQNKGE